MSMPEPLIKKATIANVVSGFIVVTGVILMAMEFPTSEIIIGAGLGYLFGANVRKP